MSFALRPSERSARLLGPPPEAPGGRAPSPASERSEHIQAAIEAVHRFAAEVRREARGLSAARQRPSSARHVEQIASTARGTVTEARRWLRELAVAAEASGDTQRLLRLKIDKLSEDVAAAAAGLEQSCREFAEADAAWARRAEAAAAADAAGEVDPEPEDLEQGASADVVKVQHAELVSQAELDLHEDIASSYAREAREVAVSMQSLSRAMVDLAEQTRAQGAALSSIEDNIGVAEAKTADAFEQVQITDARQRDSMKRTYYLLLAVSAISAGAVAYTRYGM